MMNRRRAQTGGRAGEGVQRQLGQVSGAARRMPEGVRSTQKARDYWKGCASSRPAPSMSRIETRLRAELAGESLPSPPT